MKRKIWIVSWYGMQSGGLERIVRILNQILSKNYDVQIVDIPYLCKHKGWCWLGKFKSRPLRMLTFSLFVKWSAGKEDVVITHGQNAPFVRSDFLFDHGSILSLKREMGEFIYGGSSIFEYIAVKMARHNVAVSDWTKEQIAHNYHVKRENIIVLNNCVETDMFFPIEHDKNEETVILFCGRLEEAKGLSLLQKLADFVERHTGFQLRIAANDKCNIQLFENRTNISIECGIPVEEMNHFYNSGDVLFVPSRCEGFGMGIVESLSAGVPVVTNMVGIVSELIKNQCPGVDLISEGNNIENILQLLRKSAIKYCSFESRLLLHNYVEKNYGLSSYGEKVEQLIAGESHV